MEEIKRGGKRQGAGRKSTGVQKKTISLYVEKGKIFKFGNEDKMKEKLYDFISNFGQETIIQDLSKPTNQIKPFEQPQTNYAVNTTPIQPQPIMSKFEAYRQEIIATKSREQLQKIMNKVKVDIMGWKEKQALEEIAKKHFADNFFND